MGYLYYELSRIPTEREGDGYVPVSVAVQAAPASPTTSKLAPRMTFQNLKAKMRRSDQDSDEHGDEDVEFVHVGLLSIDEDQYFADYSCTEVSLDGSEEVEEMLEMIKGPIHKYYILLQTELSGKGERVIAYRCRPSQKELVIQFDSGTSPVQRVNTINTVARQLLGRKMARNIYMVVKKLRLHKLNVIGGNISGTICTIGVFFPELNLPVDICGIICIVASLVGLIIAVLLANHSMFVRVVRKFEALYLLGIGFIGFVAAEASFHNPISAHTVAVWMFMSSCYVAMMDSMHPAQRVNSPYGVLFATVLNIVACILFLGLGYSVGLDHPSIKWTPMFVLQFGDSDESKVTIDSFSLLLNLLGTQLCWFLLYAWILYKNPCKLVILRVPVELRYILEQDFELQNRRNEALQRSLKRLPSFGNRNRFVVPANMDPDSDPTDPFALEHAYTSLIHKKMVQRDSGHCFLLSFEIEEDSKHLSSLPDSTNNENDFILGYEVGPTIKKKKKKKFLTIKVTGLFEDAAFKVNKMNTFGRRLFGQEFMTKYALFSKKTHFNWIIWVYTVLCAAVAIPHMFSPSFRQLTNNSCGPAVLFGGLGINVATMHFLIFSNVPLFRLAANEIQMYYGIILSFCGYGLFGYLFMAQDDHITGQRGYYLWSVCFHSIASYSLRDCFHPPSKLSSTHVFIHLADVLFIGVLAALLVFRASGLIIEDSKFTEDRTIKLIKGFELKFNLITLAYTNMILLVFLVFRAYIIECLQRGNLVIIRGRYVVEYLTEKEYQERVKNKASKRKRLVDLETVESVAKSASWQSSSAHFSDIG